MNEVGYKTPEYICSLLVPTPKAQQGRRVWSIDLTSVWLPFFTATNTMGDTVIPSDALGAPLRLAYDKDGSVRFNRNGRPVTRVAKTISEAVRLVRENFVARLQDYASATAEARPDDYALQVELAQEAGKPIIDLDKANLHKAIQLQIAEAMKEAEGKLGKETEVPTTEPEKELATA